MHSMVDGHTGIRACGGPDRRARFSAPARMQGMDGDMDPARMQGMDGDMETQESKAS
jgi:hypothetical protein